MPDARTNRIPADRPGVRHIRVARMSDAACAAIEWAEVPGGDSDPGGDLAGAGRRRRVALRVGCAPRRRPPDASAGSHDGNMTSHIDSSAPPSLLLERQSVLDDLNLSMLFLETARVETVPPSEPDDLDVPPEDAG